MAQQERKRFIYRTRGVCPPEIHFSIEGSCLHDVRFVGGGCPGNAELVCRLIRGRPVRDILPLLDGIECRDGTSCPRQLSEALTRAMDGGLAPADSFRLACDETPRRAVALVGELGGDGAALGKIIAAAGRRGAQALYCLGNLTDGRSSCRELVRTIHRNGIFAVLGERDWRCACQAGDGAQPSMPPRDRDRLAQMPQVLRFTIGGRCGVAFFGAYLQQLPGYSDFEPFALEMNMVCGLADFMRDENVLPALAAMTPQFEADVIVFSQSRQWIHRQVGGRHFIGTGPALDRGRTAWGLLRAAGDKINFSVENAD